MSDYFKQLQQQKIHGKPPVEKKKYVIPKKSEKKLKQEKEEKELSSHRVTKLELDVWFNTISAFHCSTFGGCNCMECGAWIPQSYMRAATAHLLPKKLFKSVAVHPQNYLILGAGCGCHQKTDRIDKFVTMSVWPKAAHRIKEMIPLLPFDELKYLSSQLLKALDNTPI